MDNLTAGRPRSRTTTIARPLSEQELTGALEMVKQVVSNSHTVIWGPLTVSEKAFRQECINEYIEKHVFDADAKELTKRDLNDMLNKVYRTIGYYMCKGQMAEVEELKVQARKLESDIDNFNWKQGGQVA